jgi:hypothetical protein
MSEMTSTPELFPTFTFGVGFLPGQWKKTVKTGKKVAKTGKNSSRYWSLFNSTYIIMSTFLQH